MTYKEYEELRDYYIDEMESRDREIKKLLNRGNLTWNEREYLKDLEAEFDYFRRELGLLNGDY